MTAPGSQPAGAGSASGPPGAPATLVDCTAVLTHHWLVRPRGGERVLRALCDLLPGRPIYTFVYDSDGAGAGWPEVRASWLQRLPGAVRHYPRLLPLMPLAARTTRLPAVDLVVCSDASLAKAMRPHPRSVVVCYCHSPPRYLWDMADEYRAQLPGLIRPLWDLWLPRLRAADRRAADRVDCFVANSRHVADRIRRCYSRDSEVIYPPVELPPQPTLGGREPFYVAVGFHVPYKRLDLAIAACAAARRRLIVIGEGPDVTRFKQAGESGVQFVGWQPDDVVADYLARARGMIFAGEEDFGIVPVEAMARGCGVVAYGVGGARETVLDGRTGVLFDRQEVTAVSDALLRLERLSLDPRVMFEHARRFARERFMRAMSGLLSRALSDEWRARSGGTPRTPAPAGPQAPPAA